MSDSDFRATHGLKVSDTHTSSEQQSYKELVSEPKYNSLDNATDYIVLPDNDSEHIVTKIGWSSGASATGKFFIHNNDGVAKGQEVSFGARSGDDMRVHIPMGAGNPICYSSTTQGGQLSVYVEYYTVKRSSRQATAEAYGDA